MITTPNHTVTDEAQQISPTPPAGYSVQSLQIQVNTEGGIIYLGGPDVAATGETRGIKVTDAYEWSVQTGESLYAIADAAATVDITVMVLPS